MRRNYNEARVIGRKGNASLGKNDDKWPVPPERTGPALLTWRAGHNSTAEVFLPNTETGIRSNF